MKRALLAGLMTIAVVMVPRATSAGPFLGIVEYAGNWSLPDADGFDDESDLGILGASVLTAADTFALEGMAPGNPLVHATPLTYDPAVAPAGPLWTHVASGISFVLTSFTVTDVNNLEIEFEGIGYFTGAGYDDTPGVWSLNAQRADGTLSTGTYFAEASVSSDEPAPVPEPATLVLLGSGLIGVCTARRRTRR